MNEPAVRGAPKMKKAASAPEGEPGSGAAASQTLLRGLDVLEAVAQEPLALAELAAQLGLTRSTAHRLASALTARRYLTSVSGRGYQLGPKLLELGSQAQRQTDVLQVAKPVLAALSRATGLPAFIGAREGDSSVNLFSVAGKQRVAVITPVGTRRRLAETSLGKALMLDDSEAEWERHVANADPAYRPLDWHAEMQRSVTEGLVIHAGPPPDHVRAIAAPVRNSSGKIVAAISMVTVSQYMDVEAIAEVAPQLRDAADRISAELGHQPASERSQRPG